MIENLFSTPLGVYTYTAKPELVKDIFDLSQSDGDGIYNIWDSNLTREVSNLRMQFAINADDYYRSVMGNYMAGGRLVNVEGKINIQYPAEYFPLHSHSHVHIAGVYYATVPENSGDLLLVDPRGDNNWNDRVDGKFSNLSYQRIKPVAGQMYFFPGYLQHMVEPNKSDKIRISVVSNFYVSRSRA